MSRVAAQPDEAARRRTARGTLLLGLLICVPRLVLVWFARPVVDILAVGTTLVFVGGLLVIAFGDLPVQGAARTERLAARRRRRGERAGRGIVLRLLPAGQAQIAYDGGVLAPPAAIAYQYFYLLLGAMSQLGLMLIVGAVGVADHEPPEPRRVAGHRLTRADQILRRSTECTAWSSAFFSTRVARERVGRMFCRRFGSLIERQKPSAVSRDSSGPRLAKRWK